MRGVVEFLITAVTILRQALNTNACINKTQVHRRAHNTNSQQLNGAIEVEKSAHKRWKMTYIRENLYGPHRYKANKTN